MTTIEGLAADCLATGEMLREAAARTGELEGHKAIKPLNLQINRARFDAGLAQANVTQRLFYLCGDLAASGEVAMARQIRVSSLEAADLAFRTAMKGVLETLRGAA
jgi:hypothetical protein